MNAENIFVIVPNLEDFRIDRVHPHKVSRILTFGRRSSIALAKLPMLNEHPAHNMVSIDPLLTLAVSMHAQKGVYAILLGSGVSRSAQIPTGWEVVLDLTSRLATASGIQCEGEAAAAWYKTTYGEPPDYSRLLDALAATPAERQQLLCSYFEPKEGEAEQGIKAPTLAHKAVAELVGDGHVRVILTTNFDRLAERAIEARGVTPAVIASPEAAEGALPLVHSLCTVIKLHGDYLDTRLKNTVQELETYDARIDVLLDRVLDEYGMIVCGWSAQWDRALRAAFERRHSRRFTIYWVSRGEPTEEARRLIDLCQARLILSEGADAFFPALAEKVRAVGDLEVPDPLTPAVAAATVKRYLAEDRYRIRLNDLVGEAVREAAREFDSQNFGLADNFTETEFLRRVKIYEAGTEVLRQMIVPLCHWVTTERHQVLATNMLELGTDYSLVNQAAYTEPWKGLRLYPSLLLLYAGGIAALSAENYRMFAALLTGPKYHDHDGERPLLLHCCAPLVLRADLKRFLPGYLNHRTPASDYLADLLHPLMQTNLPLKYRYDECFDRFEYLMALVFADLREKFSSDTWGPIGRFGWRYRYGSDGILQVVADEVSKFGADWAPLKAGLFDGSLDRLNAVKSAFDGLVKRDRVTYH